jgi:hypothetical protein
VAGPLSFVPQVTREHLDASADALGQLCELTTTAAVRPEGPVIDVRIGHYDHGAFLTLALSGFALFDTTSEGRLLPVGEGNSVRYAVVVNRSVDDQISQTLTFLASLVARQAVTGAIRRGEGEIDDIDRRVAELDRQVATALSEQLRTEHWRQAAAAIAQRARSAGLGLQVRFANPLLDGDAVRRRVPVLRHVYNSMEPLRAAIDRVVGAISRSLTIEGAEVPAALLAQTRDILDVGGVRRYTAHLLRDTMACGNGYLAIGERQPALRLLSPESVEILGPDTFALRSNGGPAGVPITDHVLHLRGGHQVGSEYGVSLLEPFVVLLGQREVFDRNIQDAERFPPSTQRDAWLATNRRLRERVAADQARRVEVLLGDATTQFAPAPPDLYFPGLEEMAPAVSRLSFLDDTDRMQ